MSELKLCPFCGSDDLAVDAVEICVRCRGCGTSGPVCTDIVWTLNRVRELWNTRPREAALEARVKELGQNITAASNQFWAEQKRLVAALAQRGAAVEKLLDSFDYMNSNCRDCPFENPCCQYGNGEDCCRAAAERWAYLPAPSPEDAA